MFVLIACIGLKDGFPTQAGNDLIFATSRPR
jgi:hypothetical protein